MREDFIKELVGQLDNFKTLVLTGPEGIGKSWTAIELIVAADIALIDNMSDLEEAKANLPKRPIVIDIDSITGPDDVPAEFGPIRMCEIPPLTTFETAEIFEEFPLNCRGDARVVSILRRLAEGNPLVTRKMLAWLSYPRAMGETKINRNSILKAFIGVCEELRHMPALKDVLIFNLEDLLKNDKNAAP